MRPLFLAALIALTSAAHAPAQVVPTLPNLSYPEPGTFCGPLQLCEPVQVTKDE